MKYFTIPELTRSVTAQKRGINNTPTPEAVKNLTALVDNVLDPLREQWGAPLIVTSGYRCPALNTAVGGVKTSHHKLGMAADLVTKENTPEANKRLFETLLKSGLKWTQAIWERNAKGQTWVHVAYDPANLKSQIIYA